MARNRVFRVHEIDSVANLIRTWPEGEKISWEGVCQRAKLVFGFTPTRQGLSIHKPILLAFQAKKSGLRNQPDKPLPMPSSLAVAAQRIKVLNDRNAELERENAMLRDRFIVWQYNASMRLTKGELDRPLPQTSRRKKTT
ncbi:hypothetical protein [Herbaspirillum robiniae]|uniref:hypothetical protein n=1 Tax=Herbaspirillum robiniae TaxID=2014887 RepID=UPI0011E4CEE6|nr:hypothetical protein [Herbaspirillum robiniae]